MQSNLDKVKHFIGIIFLIGTAGCFQHYYKVTTSTAKTQSQKASVVDSLNNQNRYFILRNGSYAYSMRNIAISADKKNVDCILENVPLEHELYVAIGSNTNHASYKPRDPDQAGVINEIHLYIVPDTAVSQGHYALPLDSLKRIEVIQKDKGRTTGSYVLGAVGITASVLAIFALVVGVALANALSGL